MDLNTVSHIVPLTRREDFGPWRPGSAWLAGGTWLFSEPQPHLDNLLDLTGLGWPPLTFDERGLRIAATCTLSELNAFAAPLECRALDLIAPCYDALQGSFKIWNMATVGGNICLALPAASMVALAVALEGSATIWTPDGEERHMQVIDFVRGAQQNALAPGEVLRAVDLPMSALRRRAACRKLSLSPLGRSAALLIGTRDQDGFALTITAATDRPVRLVLPPVPTREALAAAVAAAVPDASYLSDVHGRRAWRRQITHRLAEDIRAELCEGEAP